ADEQRYAGDEQELNALHRGVGARSERPHAVEIPVRNAARQVPDGEIARPWKAGCAFLNSVRDDEVHYEPGRADNSELDELPESAALRNVVQTIQPNTNRRR